MDSPSLNWFSTLELIFWTFLCHTLLRVRIVNAIPETYSFLGCFCFPFPRRSIHCFAWMLTWALRHPPGSSELVGLLRVWNLCYTNLHRWLLLKSLHRLTTAHTSSETLIKMSTRSEPNFSLFQHSMHIYATIEESARGAAPGPLPRSCEGSPAQPAACRQGPGLEGRLWDSQPGQEPALTGPWCTAAPAR